MIKQKMECPLSLLESDTMDLATLMAGTWKTPPPTINKCLGRFLVIDPGQIFLKLISIYTDVASRLGLHLCFKHPSLIDNSRIPLKSYKKTIYPKIL